MYRRYTTLHLLITLAAFSVAAVWIALSAARHGTAKSDCQARFFANTTEASEGDTLCNIFPWVDVGVMGGLWLLLAISQVTRKYAQPDSMLTNGPAVLLHRCLGL